MFRLLLLCSNAVASWDCFTETLPVFLSPRSRALGHLDAWRATQRNNLFLPQETNQSYGILFPKKIHLSYGFHVWTTGLVTEMLTGSLQSIFRCQSTAKDGLCSRLQCNTTVSQLWQELKVTTDRQVVTYWSFRSVARVDADPSVSIWRFGDRIKKSTLFLRKCCFKLCFLCVFGL